MAKRIRITLLLALLIIVGYETVWQKFVAREWEEPLELVIYPINAENDAGTAAYINHLSDVTFAPIARFFQQATLRHGLLLHPPFIVKLGPTLHTQPPTLHGGSPLQAILWSLRLRWWAWRNTPEYDSLYPTIRMYVLYHPLRYEQALAHSLGLQKGMLGVVNAFAHDQQTEQNNLIIAHEALHTLGATDQYDLATNQPLTLANPEQTPRYPQKKATLMAGRIALSANTARMPQGLDECVIGQQTAREIGWDLAAKKQFES